MVNAAHDLQAHLEAEWSRAEAYLDTGKPLTERFWANMEKFWQAMERFDAVENSYRRAGVSECLCGESGFATCRVHDELRETAQPVKESKLGRSKDGSLYLIETLNF